MSKIITAAVEENAEKKFRNAAKAIYGDKKGAYGKALSDAMRIWADKGLKKKKRRAVELLREGIHMGKLKYKNREDLYDL